MLTVKMLTDIIFLHKYYHATAQFKIYPCTYLIYIVKTRLSSGGSLIAASTRKSRRPSGIEQDIVRLNRADQGQVPLYGARPRRRPRHRAPSGAGARAPPHAPLPKASSSMSTPPPSRCLDSAAVRVHTCIAVFAANEGALKYGTQLLFIS